MCPGPHQFILLLVSRLMWIFSFSNHTDFVFRDLIFHYKLKYFVEYE